MIKTLVLTGANNHDWRRSAPFCKALLEGTGKFTVDLTEDPNAFLTRADSLQSYRLFLLDYNGPLWNETAREKFARAVRAGTGLVVLHAADNAFEGWSDYERMVGLLWRQGTGHGEFHEFQVVVTDRDHPITKGMDDFHPWDELYHRLVHLHNVPYRVLATAYSDAGRGGSGREEPVLIVTEYGRGRVFHTVLGHVWPGDPTGGYKGASMIALENPGFQQSLLRGCEWAATGRVAD